MIVIDVAEKPYVFKAFDKLGIPYKKEELRFPEKCNLYPIRNKEDRDCIPIDSLDLILEIEPEWERDTMRCEECQKKSIRIGDFTNDSHSFVAERKRVDDFYSSMVDGRLYDQARKMYQWFNGLKLVILEGMGTMQYFEDGFNPFDKIDQSLKEDYAKSPIQQLLDLKPDKHKWIWGMVGDLASCGVSLIQTWNLEETVMFIRQIAEGSGHEPKIRSIPKKIGGLSLDEQILATISGIGKGRAQNIIAEYGSLGKMISAIRKMPKKEANEHSITKKLKEVFG